MTTTHHFGPVLRGLFAVWLATIAIASPLKAQSQEKVPCTVYTVSGDTLEGFAILTNSRRKARKLSFWNRAGERTVFEPQDLTGFLTDSVTFESALVDIEVSPINRQDLTHDSEFIIRKKHLFLSRLTEGEKALYRGLSNDGNEGFYLKKAGTFTLLKYKKYLFSEVINGILKRLEGENTEFRSQLMMAFGDCPKLIKKIDRVPYEMEALIELFHRYESCKDAGGSGSEAPAPSKEISFPGVKMELTLGGGYSDFRNRDPSIILWQGNQDEQSRGYGVAVGLQAFFSNPLKRPNTHFTVGLQMLHYSQTYLLTDINGGGIKQVQDGAQVMLKVGIRNAFGKGKTRPFVEAGGLVVGHFGGASRYYSRTSADEDFSPLESINPRSNSEPFFLGLNLGVGIERGRVSYQVLTYQYHLWRSGELFSDQIPYQILLQVGWKLRP
ncbi:hypothetical protein [Pontibacter sp. G13]|uniref:hypothetical protein n=1 Tax=Pontibacter sp. G13 TaxID=3074898 RepID=UPI00288AF6C3|nr:hypothetical protein [Pontibacter sp. G13]WNJ20506.1 hypothetical protein RJD25_08490 [Pontibacter sp. G13]